MPLPDTFQVRTPSAVTRRHGERRTLWWLNPRPLAKGPLIARLGVGIIMVMHGLQKIGLFGGAGWSATIATFETGMHIPPALGALAILTELIGGACLIAGFAARFWALGVAIEMTVAAVLAHVKNGFFLNWFLEPGKGHGFEMNLALVALAVIVLVDGAGRLALDTRIARALAFSDAPPSDWRPTRRAR